MGPTQEDGESLLKIALLDEDRFPLLWQPEALSGLHLLIVDCYAVHEHALICLWVDFGEADAVALVREDRVLGLVEPLGLYAGLILPEGDMVSL